MECPVCGAKALLMYRELVIDTLKKEYECEDGHITKKEWIRNIYDDPDTIGRYNRRRVR